MTRKGIWNRFDHIKCSDTFCQKMERMLSAPPVPAAEEDSVGGVMQISENKYRWIASAAAVIILLVGAGSGIMHYHRMQQPVVPMPLETTDTQASTAWTESTTATQSAVSGDMQTESTTATQSAVSGDMQTESTTATQTAVSGETATDTTTTTTATGTQTVPAGTGHDGTTMPESTTTTMHHDWAVILDYDRSAMEIGETREVEYYHPWYRGEPLEISIISCSDNVSYEIDESNNRIYVTALAAGDASVCVRGRGAMFDSYISLHVEGEIVIPDYGTMLEYDTSPMKIGETRAIRYYHPQKPYEIVGCWTVSEVSSNISYYLDEERGCVYVTALTAGDASLYIGADGCAFGAYARLTVKPDLAPVLEYDSSPMKIGETRFIRYYHPERPQSYEGCYLQGEDYDLIECWASDQYGNVLQDGGYICITALAPGEVELIIRMDDCTLSSTIRLTISS
ncbi:MAG: hypothetical protein IKL00_05435 [Oscillospiraceae bacterium]|nr:hypothetical protein [Oscillospiraceae bacterium]